ncbi:MAG: hypothetical protein KBC42_02580 [Candidatus Pacebacteria bacterium]|nr:hypothetical protein [Candidatus Paceibacterota bacterium]MBP9780786.1 hypothetical protein [Candidatus Paceibacterota bacterium]
MHHTRLSIFILPVLIIGLSIFTTYVEENPSFAALFSISQVANPTAGEEASQNIEEVVSDALEEAEEIIDEGSPDVSVDDPVAEDLDTPTDEAGIDPDVAIEEEVGVSEEQGDPDISEEPTTEAPSEESGQGGGGGASESEETPAESTPEESEPETPEETPAEIIPEVVEEIVEEVPLDDAALLAEKIAKYEVSKSMISSRFQQNLFRLEQTRDEIRAKIAAMEQAGKDVSRANEALANLEDAIVQSKRYMRDSAQPESIGAVQSMLIEYVNNIRTSLNTGYSQLFNVIKETQ